MADVTEITLGGLKYGIGRLTIGQLIEIGALQVSADSAPRTAEAVDDSFVRAQGRRMIDTIAAALTKVAPEITTAKVSDLEMTMDELRMAYTKVLVHAGLAVAKEPAPGEAPGSP